MGLGLTVPWAILMTYQAYQHGVKQGKMPEPFYFIGGTAVMMIGAIIGMADNRLGILFNWSMLLGAFVSGSVKPVPKGSESLTLVAGPDFGSTSSNLPTTAGGTPIQ